MNHQPHQTTHRRLIDLNNLQVFAHTPFQLRQQFLLVPGLDTFGDVVPDLRPVAFDHRPSDGADLFVDPALHVSIFAQSFPKLKCASAQLLARGG